MYSTALVLIDDCCHCRIGILEEAGRFASTKYPGRCSGLGVSGFYLSLRPVTVGSASMG